MNGYTNYWDQYSHKYSIFLYLSNLAMNTNVFIKLQLVRGAEFRKLMRPFLYYILGLFDSNNIKHFADYGTLLGVIRFSHELYWDDDYDFFILGGLDKLYELKGPSILSRTTTNLTNIIDDTEQLKCAYKCNINNKIYHLYFQLTEWNFIKIYACDEKNTYIGKIVDIFTTNDIFRKLSPRQIMPLTRKKFGKIEVNVMADYHNYLVSFYGSDYMTKYTICNHYIDDYYDWKDPSKYISIDKNAFMDILKGQTK